MLQFGKKPAVAAVCATAFWFASSSQVVAGEPFLVRNINTMPIGVGSNPVFLGTIGGVAYFSADDGIHGRELWRTDGTTAGTSIVKDIQTGSGSSSPTNFVVIGTTAYFAATTSSAGTELWVTDGTEGGTRMVVEIAPGTLSSDP